ncbi:MAG: peptidylprolyl isomerase, partial [Planctomycetota bacterium]
MHTHIGRRWAWLAALVLGWSVSSWGQESVPATAPGTQPDAVARPVAVITTNHGEVRVELLTDAAPRTVANFVGLAQGTRPFKDPESGQWVERPFYDGVIFHRVI